MGVSNGAWSTSNYYYYNADGQVNKKDITGNGYTSSNLIMNYDDAGRLNSIGAGVQNSNYFYTNYSYNKDRLEKVQTNGQQTASTSDSDYALYQYYADGKLKKITYPKLNDNTYLTTEYLYNALGRMTSMSNKKENTVLSQFTYTYDANGNILSINDGKTTKTYKYDKLNRLKSIQTSSGNEIVYTYDLRSNRKTSNNSNDVSSIQNTSYSYDLENKLKSVTMDTNTTAMTYYADGYRAKKTTGANATSYIYNLDGKVVSTETTKNGSTTRDNYVWGPDRVLAGSKAGGEGYYYLYNGHGDVIQIVDKSGNVVNNYMYDEWGNITTSNETVSNPFKYAGEVYDQETGLYYLRARYYDPSTGRFLNEDTDEGQVNNPLSLNLYSYCFNNPILFIDPTGNRAIDVTRKLARVLIGNPVNNFVTRYPGMIPEVLFYVGGFWQDKNGVYHARQDALQQYGGYNSIYDIVFDYSTSMKPAITQFTHDGQEFRFWAWKGDYLNLGAGCELGIYTRLVVNGNETDHWLAYTSSKLYMTLTLRDNKGNVIADYNPSDPQWWITGFNPFDPNVQAGNLTAYFTVDFSNDKGMYNDFINSDAFKNNSKWSVSPYDDYTLTYTF